MTPAPLLACVETPKIIPKTIDFLTPILRAFKKLSRVARYLSYVRKSHRAPHLSLRLTGQEFVSALSVKKCRVNERLADVREVGILTPS